jgi:hypothetical protein
MQSEAIGELAAALAKAQAEIQPPTKGKTAKLGTYGYNYADLADVIASYKAPLSKHGLAVTQTTRVDEGHMVLVTSLLHSSGQWIASEYPLANYAKPQEQGSAITYARRYSVTSLLGIAAEDDDDGQAAQQAEPVKREAKAPARPKPRHTSAPIPGPVSEDAAAIAVVAGQLAEMTRETVEAIVEAASAFTDDSQNYAYFTDPTRVSSAKWLKGTRTTLEKRLQTEAIKREPGVAEAAELFR